MRQPTPGEHVREFYRAQGERRMFDAIIAKPRLAAQSPNDMEYWVDVHERDAETFIKHCRKYALRKNIKIEDISHIIKSFTV